MKIQRALIIGSNGTAGKSFIRQMGKKNIQTIGLARNNADYCIDLLKTNCLEKTIRDSKADLVVNCAAIVSLADCQDKPSVAKHMNAEIVKVMAKACFKYEKKFVHISTDHFYMNDEKKLHSEKDKITIYNEYAKTKHLGEVYAKTFDDSLIIRTNITGIRGISLRPTYFEWLYSSLIMERQISLFTDFYTSTINADLLAKYTIIACEKEIKGIINIASCECLSKKDFALILAETLSTDISYLRDASVRELRPIRANSLGLDCTLCEDLLGLKMPTAKQVISDLVESINNEVY